MVGWFSGGHDWLVLGGRRGEAWDFVVHHANGDQYVQVKVYKSVAKALAAIKEVNAKLAAGIVKGYDGSHTVTKIDFAVNEDIYHQVKEEVARQKLHVGVQSIGATRSQIQEGLQHVDHRFLQNSPLHNYFHDLFKGALVGTALIGAINGFQVWQGSKSLEDAIEDTIYGAVTTTGGMASVLTSKMILGGIMGPAGYLTAIGLGVGSRAVMGRFFDRRHIVDRFIEDNNRLKKLCAE